MWGVLERQSPGLDNLPSWFLRLLSPFLAKPLSEIYNRSLNSAQIPQQWKCSVITPVAKIPRPVACSDFRPISVTPILSRLLEKIVVTDYLYPTLITPKCEPIFMDQYAFRPSGSTTAALVSLIHKITNLLQKYPYVHVIALDFSKAFDTIRHSTLAAKCADLPLDDAVHNWLMEFLEGRMHCTKFGKSISSRRGINASIVQGSGIGPASYIICASDLKTMHPDNSLDKYADDTYLIIPSVNSSIILEEMDHISKWAKNNNLTLNINKTMEMIVRKPRAKNLPIPPEIDGIKRVKTMKVLGVFIQDNLSFGEHVDHLVAQGAQTLYALRILKHHGLNGPNLWTVANSTLLARLTYASPAWWGLIGSEGLLRLKAVVSRAVKQGYLPPNQPAFDVICDKNDVGLFKAIMDDRNHVLNHLLPPVKHGVYNMRQRTHNRTIPDIKDSLFRKTFINRMIFRHSY